MILQWYETCLLKMKMKISTANSGASQVYKCGESASGRLYRQLLFVTVVAIHHASRLNDTLAFIPTEVSLLGRQSLMKRSEFFVMARSQSSSHFVLHSKEQQQTDEWLSSAAKIREDIRQLESEAAALRQGKNPALANSKSLPRTITYTDLADSIWSISYRFANDPESPTTEATNRRLFGGKIILQFREDGYTNLLSQESYGSPKECCEVIKAWGWDIELSKDNDKDASGNDQEFILFSVDVKLPQNDTGRNSSKERFYFQARKDTDARTGVILLSDGTVTVKRDIVEKSTRWGFFSPSGILAQFRYVGGFVAKAEQIDST